MLSSLYAAESLAGREKVVELGGLEPADAEVIVPVGKEAEVFIVIEEINEWEIGESAANIGS